MKIEFRLKFDGEQRRGSFVWNGEIGGLRADNGKEEVFKDRVLQKVCNGFREFFEETLAFLDSSEAEPAVTHVCMDFFGGCPEEIRVDCVGLPVGPRGSDPIIGLFAPVGEIIAKDDGVGLQKEQEFEITKMGVKLLTQHQLIVPLNGSKVIVWKPEDFCFWVSEVIGLGFKRLRCDKYVRPWLQNRQRIV